VPSNGTGPNDEKRHSTSVLPAATHPGDDPPKALARLLGQLRQFTGKLEVSRRTIMRDLDFLRDDENAPIAYDDSRKGFTLTDATFVLPPVQITRREGLQLLYRAKAAGALRRHTAGIWTCARSGQDRGQLAGRCHTYVESLIEQFSVLSEGPMRA